jgi:hypothetical protein
LTAEDVKVTAENVKVTAEDVKVTAEDVKVTAEDVKVAAEDVKVTAEDVKVTAEDVKVAAEDVKVTAEDVKVAAEEESTVNLPASVKTSSNSLFNPIKEEESMEFTKLSQTRVSKSGQVFDTVDVILIRNENRDKVVPQKIDFKVSQTKSLRTTESVVADGPSKTLEGYSRESLKRKKEEEVEKRHMEEKKRADEILEEIKLDQNKFFEYLFLSKSGHANTKSPSSKTVKHLDIIREEEEEDEAEKEVGLPVADEVRELPSEPEKAGRISTVGVVVVAVYFLFTGAGRAQAKD